MNKRFFFRFFLFTATILAFVGSGCEEGYRYLKETPEESANSIYATLCSDARFSTYVQLLQRMDSAYITILDRTGSRTLFVPTNEAFAAFFQNNPYGYKGVNDMPTTAIRIFLSYYTLENSYVTAVLGSAQGPEVGGCLRRFTTYERTDSIAYTDQFPDNPQFARFKGKKMYLTTPGEWTLLHFSEPYFRLTGMKAEDYNALYPQSPWKSGDIALFDAKVLSNTETEKNRDIVNKNGYIHVVDKVVLPPPNMYEYIRDKPGIGIFKKLMERFCEPVYDEAATASLRSRYPGIADSVYTVGFFYTGDRYVLDDYGNRIKVDNLLFSPAANSRQNTGLVNNIGEEPREMPVIFAPADEAMQHYLETSQFYSYGSWDNVPDDIVAKFLTTHMKRLFADSYPTRLANCVDDVKGDPMFRNFNYSQIVRDVAVCRNGVVYTIDATVPPRDFSTVVAPILNDDRTKIVNWIINASYNNKKLKYNYYLTSLENTFRLFVPIDDAFKLYLDPVNQADGLSEKRQLSFSWMEDLKGVTYRYCDMNGNPMETVIGTPNFSNESDPVLTFVQNRMQDIMDYHIVVGDIADNQTYVQTKGGTYFKIDRQGGKMRLQGAGDMEAGRYVNVINEIETLNGTVYFIDKRIEHTLYSPYRFLNETPRVSLFNEMLNTCNDPDKVFFPEAARFRPAVNKLKEYEPLVFFRSDGLNFVFPFLGSFDYTLFVPTNTAMEEAFRAGLVYTEDDIKALHNDTEKIEAIKHNIRFLKNHFVDKSIFTRRFYNAEDGKQVDNYQLPNVFTTSAKDPDTRIFYSVSVSGGEGSPLVITDAQGRQAATLAENVDRILRQYRFTGSGIGSSSRITVHLINKALSVPQK